MTATGILFILGLVAYLSFIYLINSLHRRLDTHFGIIKALMERVEELEKQK